MSENFSTEAVEKIFTPFLQRLIKIRGLADRKIISYLVANEQEKIFSLADFLEKIGRENLQFKKIHAIALQILLSGETDLDKLQNEIREIKFEDDGDKIILLVGNETLLNENIRALADYTVLIQSDENFSKSVNEIWQLKSDGNISKLEDDAEDFMEDFE